MPEFLRSRSVVSIDFVRTINWKSRRTLSVIFFIAVALIGFMSYRALTSGNGNAVEKQTPLVKVARVSDLMGGGYTLSVIADIRSVNEAKISPESGGRVIRVLASLGDRVAAGHILAELENSSQRAAVLQAEGARDAAHAALKKVRGGTREEQLAILQSSLASAKGSAVTSLLTAYASVDSAVNDSADDMFSGIEIGQIQFIPQTSNQQRETDLESRRAALQLVLSREETMSGSISVSSDLKRELQLAEDEVRGVRTFIDILLAALGDAIDSSAFDSSDIAAAKADATAARTSLTAALAGITAAKAGLETAEKNLEQGETGAQSEDVASAEAALKQAQGAYSAAVANLEKTIIRSPIAGTLNNFTIKLGDTVAPAQEIAIVSNNAALEAIAYVTEEDKPRISVGQTVAIEGNIAGTITKIAPALDPVTRRIEVRIGLPATATKMLTNGQSVRIELAKGEGSAKRAPATTLSIPITALKMEASRTVVYTVVEGKLVAREITIGRLSGEYIQVQSGLDAETEIVVDVRGLKEGDMVERAASSL